MSNSSMSLLFFKEGRHPKVREASISYQKSYDTAEMTNKQKLQHASHFLQLRLQTYKGMQLSPNTCSDIIGDNVATEVFDANLANDWQGNKGHAEEVGDGTAEAIFVLIWSFHGRSRCNGRKKMLKPQASLHTPKNSLAVVAVTGSIISSPSSTTSMKK